MAIPKNPIERDARLRPIASPVDTFIQPQQPQRSQLWDLAEGLSKLESGLSNWVQSKKGEQAEADRLRGEAAFYTQNADGMAEGVRNGSIPAFASPDFARGYKGAQGQALGGRFEQDFTAAYSMWDQKGSEDPAAFDQFFNGFVKDYVGNAGNDPDVLRGFLPQFHQTADQVRSKNTQDRADQFYQKGLKAHSAAVNQLIDSASDAGLLRREGVNYEELWANMLRVREQALSVGVRPEDFDKEMMTSISAKALEIGDHQLIGLLEKQLPGVDYKFSDLPDGRDLKNDTEGKLTDIAIKRDREDRLKQEREDKERYNGNLATVLDGITQDPNAVIPDDVMRDMEKVDPDVRLKIAGARKTLSEASGGFEDPNEVQDLYKRIMDGTAGRAQILKAVESGIIKSPSTVAALTTFADKYQGDSGQAAEMLKSATARQYLDAIAQRTTLKDNLNMFGQPGGLTNSGLAATTDFRRFIHEWSAAHPNATIEEKAEAIDNYGRRILGGVGTQDQGDSVTGAVPYSRPADAPGAAPPGATVAPPPGSQPPPIEGGEAPIDPNSPEQRWLRAPTEEPVWTRAPRLEDLTPRQRERIERVAKTRGLTPQMYLDQQWRRLNDLEGGQPGDITGSLGGGDEVGRLLDTARQAATGLAQLGESLGAGGAGDARSQAPSARSLIGFSRRGESAPDQGIDSPFPQDAGEVEAPLLDKSAEAGIGDRFGRFKPGAVKGLIIHHTGGRGDAAGVVGTFKQRGFPAQFVLERDGTLIRVLPEGARGRHMRNGQGPGEGLNNGNTEGIEVVARDNNDWTEAQKQTLARFAVQHAKGHGYDPLMGIFGHGEVNPHKQATEGQAFVAWFRRHFGGDTRMASLIDDASV